MELKDIEVWVDAGFKTPKRKGRGVKRKTLSLIGVILVGALVLTASAGLLQYFARIESSLTVTGVITINGQEAPYIFTDDSPCQPGSSVTDTYRIENAHDTLTYNLSFSVLDCAEGLTITFPDANESTNWFWVQPLGHIDMNITYTLAPNFDPSSDANSTIELVFNDAFEV